MSAGCPGTAGGRLRPNHHRGDGRGGSRSSTWATPVAIGPSLTRADRHVGEVDGQAHGRDATGGGYAPGVVDSSSRVEALPPIPCASTHNCWRPAFGSQAGGTAPRIGGCPRLSPSPRWWPWRVGWPRSTWRGRAPVFPSSPRAGFRGSTSTSSWSAPSNRPTSVSAFWALQRTSPYREVLRACLAQVLDAHRAPGGAARRGTNEPVLAAPGALCPCTSTATTTCCCSSPAPRS